MTVTELIAELQEMPPDMPVKYIAGEPVEVTEAAIYQEPRSWGAAQWVRLE